VPFDTVIIVDWYLAKKSLEKSADPEKAAALKN
jgi:hypothetical protein